MKSLDELDECILRESAGLNDILDSEEMRAIEKIIQPKFIPLDKRKQNKINKIANKRSQSDRYLFWVGKNEYTVARSAAGCRPIEVSNKVCLTCQCTFESEGSHNRMCSICRKVQGYED